MLVQAVLLVLALCQLVVGNSCGNITITSTDTTSLDSCSSHELESLTIASSATGAVSLASIQKITGSLTLTNTGITDLSLPDLQSIGSALRVTGNSDLRNVSLPELQSVGKEDKDDSNSGSGGDAITVKDNPALETVEMGNLQDVYGGFTLHGGFSLAISSLQEVSGAATFSGSKLSCGLFDNLAADGDFASSYTCSNGDSSKKNGLSGGDKAGIAVGVILGVLLVLGVGLWLWFRRRRAARSGPGVVPQSPGDDEKGLEGYMPVPPPPAAGAGAAGGTNAGQRTGPGAGLNIPRKPFPSQHEPPPRPEMLDGNSIYEAGAGVQSPVVYELDAGPQSRHQIPMNHE